MVSLFKSLQLVGSFLWISREYLSLKKEHDTVEGELRTLRETFNLRQDTWIKEKLDMQVKPDVLVYFKTIEYCILL